MHIPDPDWILRVANDSINIPDTISEPLIPRSHPDPIRAMTSHLAPPTGSYWLESLILRAYPSPTHPQSLRVRFSKSHHLRHPRIHRFEPDPKQVRARSGDAPLSSGIPASPHVSSVVTRLPSKVTSAPVPPTSTRDARPRLTRRRPTRASED